MWEHIGKDDLNSAVKRLVASNLVLAAVKIAEAKGEAVSSEHVNEALKHYQEVLDILSQPVEAQSPVDLDKIPDDD